MGAPFRQIAAAGLARRRYGTLPPLDRREPADRIDYALELKSYTALLNESRTEALDRMVEQGARRGRQFDRQHSLLDVQHRAGAVEVMAYRAAVAVG